MSDPYTPPQAKLQPEQPAESRALLVVAAFLSALCAPVAIIVATAKVMFPGLTLSSGSPMFWAILASAAVLSASMVHFLRFVRVVGAFVLGAAIGAISLVLFAAVLDTWPGLVPVFQP